MKVATNTTIALLCSSDQVGQDTLFLSSSTASVTYSVIPAMIYRCTGGETRTRNPWFWRPVLYQLSYTRLLIRIDKGIPQKGGYL